MNRNEPCWCGSAKKWKKCHWPALPAHSELASRYFKEYGIVLKTPAQIDGMRLAGHLAATILDELCSAAKAGVTTGELDELSMRLHKEAGAIPAPLHYGNPPYPKSICTSLNEVVCHGIPNKTPLAEGDIVNIDVTSILNGYYGDTSRMVCIGSVSPEKKHLVDVTKACLEKAIAVCKPGACLSSIGQTISDHAEANNCSVVYQFVGHGVGTSFHEAPEVTHTRQGRKLTLVPGMTFTIEPMINAGVADAIVDPKDGWTARTADGKPSAQFEHTIAITEDGCEILTSL